MRPSIPAAAFPDTKRLASLAGCRVLTQAEARERDRALRSVLEALRPLKAEQDTSGFRQDRQQTDSSYARRRFRAPMKRRKAMP